MVNTYLFWAGGAAPAGWALFSEVGDDFYHKFIRGAATYDAVGGGATTHTHTLGVVGISISSFKAKYNASSPDTHVQASHPHAIGNISCGNGNNLPAYQSLKVIKFVGVPTVLPLGAIGIFDAAPPGDWTEQTAYQNKCIYCSDAVATAGSDTHTHTVSGNSGTKTVNAYSINNGVNTAITHYHPVSGNTIAHDNIPAYLAVRFAEKNDAGALPAGLISMFDADPGTGWTIVSGVGSDFNTKFIRGAIAYGGTGGSNTHIPTNQVIQTDACSASANTGSSGTPLNMANGAHKHNMTFSFTEGDNTPPYIDVIFAKYIGSAPYPLLSGMDGGIGETMSGGIAR